MAGAGYKLFNTGDVLLASEVNTYLQQQVTMVFANATARTSALSGVLAEGMMSYLQDTNTVEVYNGSSWVNVGNAGDITEVQAGTGISVASGTGPIPVVTSTVATTFDAKGDLVVGTGADTFAKLTVGTNGYTLVADSGEATGLKWAAPGASLVGCKVTKAAETPQTIANNTGTVITWTVESFDTDGFHSNDTNTGRLTIPSGKGGKYLINANCFWQSNNTGVRLHEILLNGGSYARANFPAVSGENACCTLTTIGTFAAGDYLEVYVKQNSGGNLNFSELYTSFSCIYLGA